MTDSLERALQDLHFDLPAGLVARAQVAAAAEVGAVRRAPRGSVHSREDSDAQRQPWALALVAVLLAIAVVATLVGVRALHSPPPSPAKPPLGYHHNGYLVVSNGTGLTALDPANPQLEHVIVTLPAGGVHLTDPAYTRDGTRIAYLDGGGAIWVLDTATRLTHQLTRCVCFQWSHLSWSPDGSRLAFTDADRVGGTQIFLINADGTHKTQLTHFPLGQAASQPSWSPDGTRIAFTVGQNIDVIGTDGSGFAVLDTEKQRPFDPAWSSDGSRIAYVLFAPTPQPSREPDEYQLWLMNADGSHRTKVFVNPGCCISAWGGPAWSPDGTRIALVALPAMPPSGSGDGGFIVWVMNADGSDAQTVPGFVIGDRPAWQPVP
jgi:hypothetical protein